MQLLRKLIILNAVNQYGKGVIKLEALNNKVKGIINITELDNIEFRLGIRIGYSRLYEYEIKTNNYEFKLEDGIDLKEKIQCLIIDNKSLEPLLYGSSDGKLFDMNRILDMFTKDLEPNLFSETSEIIEVSEKQKIENSIIDVEINNGQQKDKIEDKEKDKDNQEAVNKEDKQTKRIELDEDFFESIKPQLDELFKCYPADKELMKSVPDSKWVRVEYESDSYYVVGILYNGKRATHICYGVPGEYTVRPKQKSEWLPLDYMDPEGKGYWVIFQDALTGKTID